MSNSTLKAPRKNNFQKIQSWLKTYGFELKKSDEFAVVWDDQIVTWTRAEEGIGKKCLKQDEINIMLLHECGHIFSSIVDRAHTWRQGESDDIYTNLLCEEFRAWDRAEDVADRLNIKKSTVKWKQLKNVCIKSYVRMVHNREKIDSWVLGHSYLTKKTRKKKK